MNIMITDDGRPCLTDVGLNLCLSKVLHTSTWPIPSAWMFKAPEELQFECDLDLFQPTTAMDVYTFASTVYVVSGYSLFCCLCFCSLVVPRY